MPKWSEMLAKVIPWLDTGDDAEHRQLREEIADIEREQHELAPLIADQTEYLVRRAEINGFSKQLRLGFQRRATEE